MKLLFVLPEYLPHPGGGIATFYENLLPFCAALGHEVRVILGSPFTQGVEKYQINGVHVEQLDPARFSQFTRAFKRFEVFPELRRFLSAAWAAWDQADRGDGYDLIETTDWGLPFVPWVIRPNAAPMQVQMHGSGGQIEHYDPRDGFQLLGGIIRLIESSVLRCADRIVTYSSANHIFWQQQLSRDVDYEVPGFHLSAECDPPRRPSPRANSLTGLVAARVQYWKGPSVLCEAIRRMGTTAPTILWAGRDMPYQRQSQTMGEWLHDEYPDVWGRKVQPLGLRPYQELRELQTGVDFGVVPSIWDMFNWTCVEHMSVGKAVVCSTGAGASDLIEEGDNGLLCAPDDSESLARALDKLLSNWSGASAMGERARATIRRRMDPIRIAERRLGAAAAMHQGRGERARLDDWTCDFLSPDGSSSELRALLDQLPLRELASYTVARSVARIRS